MQRMAYTEPYTIREKLAIRLTLKQWQFRGFRESGFWRSVAFKLPDRLVLWAFIRVISHASSVHGDQHPNSITYEQAYKAWDTRGSNS